MWRIDSVSTPPLQLFFVWSRIYSCDGHCSKGFEWFIQGGGGSNLYWYILVLDLTWWNSEEFEFKSYMHYRLQWIDHILNQKMCIYSDSSIMDYWSESITFCRKNTWDCMKKHRRIVTLCVFHRLPLWQILQSQGN